MSQHVFPPNGIPAVTAAQVDSDALILDVREPDEWAAGHIPEAVHIPLAALPDRAAELPSDRTVVVICRSGGRSAQAVAYLSAAGREAVNLDGGMQAWSSLGRPMQSETGATPSVI